MQSGVDCRDGGGRQALAPEIAHNAFHRVEAGFRRQRVFALDLSGKLFADESDDAGGRIGIAEADFSTALDLHQNERGGVPGNGAVRLGAISRHGVRLRPHLADRDFAPHQSFPGSTPASNSLALFFSTLPSSGSEGIMLTKFLASLNVMCGGSGGTFGSV